MFPLFFGLIFLAVIFKFVRHAAWSGSQRGGWAASGPGGGGPWNYGGSRGRHGHGRGWHGRGWDTDEQSGQSVTGPDAAQAAEEGPRGASRAGGAPRGPWTQGSKARDFWNSREVPPMVDEMFQRWHSRMHAETKSGADAESASNETNDAGSLALPANEPPADQSTDERDDRPIDRPA